MDSNTLCKIPAMGNQTYSSFLVVSVLEMTTDDQW